MQIRFNFTYNFLVGAASLARLARDIDSKGIRATEEEKLQHLAFVSGSIMQSVAALESEVWSLLNHGPGHYLGSNGLDKNGAEILAIVADSLERESILDRYDLALKLIKRTPLDFGRQPIQDTKLLIGLRNEIMHFKSLWTSKIDRKTLFKDLEKKDPTPPSFYSGNEINFFPLKCLTHSRAKWGVKTAIEFIDHFHVELGITSPLEGYDRELITI